MTGAPAGAPGRQAPRSTYVIGRLDRALRRELVRRLRGHGLTLPQFTALSVLRARPGLSNAELARRSLITPQSMSEVTGALERRRLVERRPDPAHQRVLQVRLTPAGARVLAACEAEAVAVERQMLTGLSAGERERFLATVHACLRNLGGGLDQPV